jgi:hypothetical protein
MLILSMESKIIEKASELFLKLGFKSITMDDIACEMCISKKTIYKYFSNKEQLIVKSTTLIHNQIHESISLICEKNHNAIKENFEIRKMFSEMFQNSENSPLFQLKKYYPNIFTTVTQREINQCSQWFRQNILKGIQTGLYRKDLNVEVYVKFYYTLMISIHETTETERETQILELQALEYHIRAMATDMGIKELEQQIKNNNDD